MNIVPKAEVLKRLKRIYAQIPSFECKHCHMCSNPIYWFKPEEINIQEYLKKHHLSYLTYSEEEFRINDMKCPYLNRNRCSIYPVRPLVCRLQGLIPELSCPNNTTILLSREQYDTIIVALNRLNRDVDGISEYYGTRKEITQKSISKNIV